MLDDADALDTFLRSIEPERLEDVIAALENYDGRYPIKGIGPATTVLLNILPILPERPRGFLGADARLVVTRVVLRLMRRLPSSEEVECVVRDTLPKLSTLSSRFSLIQIVGHLEHAGHKLISASAAEELERQLVEAVRSAGPAELVREWDLLRLLYWVQDRLPAATSALPARDNPDLNAKVLTDARAEVRSQDLNSRVLKRQQRLHWDVLIKLYENENALSEVINLLEATQPTDQRLIDAIALAKRYLSGWRPGDFGDGE
jgi:hypothetical protein